MASTAATTIAAAAARELLLGKVVQINKIGLKEIPVALVRCQQNVFSSYIKKYFAESTDHWAIDSSNKSNVGDTVLIRRVEKSQQPTASVMHRVDRVIFEYGNLIDPITKKRVVNEHQYFDEIKLHKKLVEEVVEIPEGEGEQEALLFDDKRAIQFEKLEKLQKE